MSILRRTSPWLFLSYIRAMCYVFLAFTLSSNIGHCDDPVSAPASSSSDVDAKKEEGQKDKPKDEPVVGEKAEKVEAKEPGPITALVHGRLLTMSDAGEIDDGTILIQDGKIKEVGASLEIPENARVIDVAGMTVTPGLIDLRSRLWLTASAAADTGTTAALNAADGVDPYSTDWQEVARQGVTSVYVQPSPRGSLGGYGVLLRVAEGDGSLETLVIDGKSGFQSSLGVATNGASSKAKLGEFGGLKKRLSDAKQYMEEWEKYRKYEEEQAKKKPEDKKAEDKKPEEKKDAAASEKDSPTVTEGPRGQGRSGRPVGPPGSGRGGRPDGPRPDGPAPAPQPKPEADKPAAEAAVGKDTKPEDKAEAKPVEKPPTKPKKDPLKDRLVEVLEGKVPLRLEVHGGEDARRALTLAKEFKITLLLEGLTDLRSAESVVAESMLPVVLGPWLESERESYQSKSRVGEWSAAFADYPGRLVIASFGRSSRSSKDLRSHAAAAVAAGMDASKVLEGVTSVPALLAGAGGERGKLLPGFAADIAVFAGEPLDPASAVMMTMSNGETTYRLESRELTAVADSLVLETNVPSVFPTSYAIKSNRILNDQGQFVPGMLRINAGKIVSVVSVDELVDGVEMFDVGDAVVTPGLVSVHAALAAESLADRQGLSDAGPVRAADVYDPMMPLIRKMVDGGFLRIVSVPGNDRVMAGQAAEIRLMAKEPVVAEELAEKVVLSGAARNRDRFPASLAGQQQLVRDAFTGQTTTSPIYLPEAALAIYEAEAKERQKEVVEGKRPVIMIAEADGEAAAAIKLTREMGLRGILAAPNQLQPLLGALADGSMGVIVRPVQSADYDWYAIDIAQLSATGAPLGFAGEDAISIRRTAAAAVQAGMERDAAMMALTSGAARMVGMSESAGKLLPEGPADFVIWSGSPLNLAAKPLAIVIDGTLVGEKK